MAAAWELISVLGRETLTDLQEALGRNSYHVPVEPNPEHPIAQAIGMRNLEKLSEAFGGTTIHVGRRYAIARRNDEVERDILRGYTVAEIAQRHGITRRYVNIIGRLHLKPVYGSRARRRRAWIQTIEREDARSRAA